jgi:hypothetical protein
MDSLFGLLGDAIGFGTSVMSGGLTGLLGVIVQRGADIWNKKQDLDKQREQWAHDRDMRRIDGELMDKEWAHRTQIAETEAQAARDVQDGKAFEASQRREPQRYAEGLKAPRGGRVAKFFAGLGWLMMVILDFVRGAVIPGLTIYLCALTTQVYLQARALLAGENLDAVQAMAISNRIVDTILYLTTTCVLWHFGTTNRQSIAKTAAA